PTHASACSLLSLLNRTLAVRVWNFRVAEYPYLRASILAAGTLVSLVVNNGTKEKIAGNQTQEICGARFPSHAGSAGRRPAAHSPRRRHRPASRPVGQHYGEISQAGGCSACAQEAWSFRGIARLRFRNFADFRFRSVR